jgi:hypothetical protein
LGVLPRAILGSLAGGLVGWLVLSLGAAQTQPLLFGLVALAGGMVVTIPFIWKELKLLVRL